LTSALELSEFLPTKRASGALRGSVASGYNLNGCAGFQITQG